MKKVITSILFLGLTIMEVISPAKENHSLILCLYICAQLLIINLPENERK